MIRTGMISILAAVAAATLSTAGAAAKDKVKVGFIGPLTSGVAANGIGGRNSAELAVKLRNADAKAKYEYEFVVLDDECKPNVGVQVATKMAADRSIVAAATHYCSAVAIGTVETYHKFGLPVIVSRYRNGALLPAGAGATLTRLFDHHAIVDDAEGLQVGDMVDLGISHPCSLFDRWREVVAVSDDAVETWRPVF